MRIAKENYNFALKHPELLSYWNDERLPNIFYPRSAIKVKWKCENNHIFEKSIDKVVCHYLKYRKLNCTECSSVVYLHPDVAEEIWIDGNKSLSYGSNKKIEFCCKACHHHWVTSLVSRTQGNCSGCPKCNKSKSCSNFEFRIISELELFFDKVEHRKKIENKEADIFIPSHSITIEVDSFRYHQGKNDFEKIHHFLKNGCFHIRVRENSLPDIYKYEVVFKKKITISTIQYILKILVDNQFLENDKVKKYKSFQNQVRYLELIKDQNIPKNSLYDVLKKNGIIWDEQNFPIEPQYVAFQSNETYWFRCSKERHKKAWPSTPSNITAGKGCPYCVHKKIDPNDSLLTCFPEVAQWLSAKNVIKADELAPKSGKKVWWYCLKGHEYEEFVYNKTIGKYACPYCSNHKKEKFRANYSEF